MTIRYDYVIIGAGPAGAALARFLTDKGFRVKVYDIAPYPGFKPCGWAVPLQVEDYIDIPVDAILTEIRGFRVYVDGELAHEKYGKLQGYIIDKPAFLKHLLEGIPFERRIVELTPELRPVKQLEEAKEIVVATGSVTPHRGIRDQIYAVQAIVRTSEPHDTTIMELWFDSSLVGYYWVFPRSRYTVDIGVGGYGEPREFRQKLIEFIRKRVKGPVEMTPIRGAAINIGGANPSLLIRDIPVIGEAAGFVYPLTGEGIRPSIASAYALTRYIASGEDPGKTLSRIVHWIGVQRKLLEKIKTARPETRAKLLRSIPTDLLPLIGIGNVSTIKLLGLIARMPSRLAEILRTLVQKT
ncbi:NAD(P)-binding protein [Hyperthermus butylicus]|uniref:Dehydrogenase, FixC domain protein n=1 Tax=Hyperthermus butylicus (strain DSM 5456 / JCM 9403 / PLM1-5) TaxID=415426 RepID=A2BIT8_HYPBU|nr:NAD(P)-binding protein [Hyperthermus butylicus]ABM79894.1 dehydrogenase, FixC domain protein [Hyperthermus butylicus DSM 5456]